MIHRALTDTLLDSARRMPVLSLTGPRQSGKSTLARAAFPSYEYVNLEELEERSHAQDDPKGFLEDHQGPVIIDEAQYAPDLFSYIQVRSDQLDKPGMYVLTGSQNFLLSKRISQSLAGRVAIHTLMPFSLEELKPTGYWSEEYADFLYRGLFPRVYDKQLQPRRWYADYIQTYLERDVRNIAAIGDLRTFRQFLGMCAGRVGQLLNLSSIGSDIGASYQTVKRWVSVLEASHILMLIPPYHANLGKRIVKSPKLYFTDPGLAAHLVGIRTTADLRTHSSRGALFENLVLTEIAKGFYNRAEYPSLFFWRDKTGHELDCVLDASEGMLALEVKSAKTIAPDFFQNLSYVSRLLSGKKLIPYLIYGGSRKQTRHGVTVLSWRQLDRLPPGSAEN